MCKEFNDEEIFSLFQNEREIIDTYIFLKENIFLNKSNKEGFQEFKETCKNHDLSDMATAFVYCEYVLNWYLYKMCISPILENFIEESNDIKTVYQRYMKSSFEIISCYYTLDYLTKQKDFYFYKDYKALKSTSTDFYSIEFTDNPQNTIHYKAKDNIKDIHGIATRNIRDASNNVFSSLINCRYVDYIPKHSSEYYINGFLPNISLQLAETGTLLDRDNFNSALGKGKNKHYKKSHLISKMQLLFKTFFEIAINVLKSEDVLQNIISIYKLEYGFGILSLYGFLRKINPLHFLQPKSGKRVLDFDQFPKFMKNLMNTQKCPRIYESARTDFDYSEIYDAELSIMISKIYLALLYNLYDNDVKKLHDEMGKEILALYNINKSITYQSTGSNTYNCSSWILLHRMFIFINQVNIENRDFYMDFISATLSSLANTNETDIQQYLLDRYSSEWFKNVKTMFQNKPQDYFSKKDNTPTDN